MLRGKVQDDDEDHATLRRDLPEEIANGKAKGVDLKETIVGLADKSDLVRMIDKHL